MLTPQFMCTSHTGALAGVLAGTVIEKETVDVPPGAKVTDLGAAPSKLVTTKVAP